MHMGVSGLPRSVRMRQFSGWDSNLQALHYVSDAITTRLTSHMTFAVHAIGNCKEYSVRPDVDATVFVIGCLFVVQRVRKKRSHSLRRWLLERTFLLGQWKISWLLGGFLLPVGHG